MPESSVAIIIVNYNGAAFLEEFASSLAAVSYSDRRLIVVNNASTDGSANSLASLFPDADITYNETNRGLAPAINQALERRGDAGYVLLLNPDTALEPDFLEKLIAVADERTLVVPKVLNYHDRTLVNTEAGGFDWTRGLFTGTYDGQPDGPATSTRREIETASFCCMLVPTSAFRAAGALDERLAMYYEDTDFVARARKAGYRLLFEPSAVVYHREGGSSGGKESPFKHYYATRNRPYIIRKHVSFGRYAFFTAYFLGTRLSKVINYTRRRERALLKAQLLAVRDFYTGRMGMTYQPSDLIEVHPSARPDVQSDAKG